LFDEALHCIGSSVIYSPVKGNLFKVGMNGLGVAATHGIFLKENFEDLLSRGWKCAGIN
jgi:hypothetical protein